MTIRTSMPCRAILATVAFGALAASPALADLPRVLDHVPADATAVIVVDNLGKFDQHFNQFLGVIEEPAMVTPSQALNQLGIGQNLNMNESAALVVLSFNPEEKDGEFVFLAPTNNFDALIGAFDTAEGGGGGISAFTVENDTIFAKPVGAWAAMSTERSTLERFTGKAGNLGAYEGRLGDSGVEMAESSDFFVSINPADMAPLVEQMKEEIANNADKLAGGQNVDQQMEMMQKIMDGFVRDGSSAGFGVRFGAMGVVGTGSLAFKPGTEGAGLFERGGDSGSLMRNLPAGPFLFAFAMDNTAPIAKASMAWVQNSGFMEMNQAMGMGAFNMTDLYEKMSGAAGAVYPNSAGFMGGIFANMITYSASDNPGELKAAMKDKYAGIQMENEQLGMSITSTYTPNETQVAGKSADAYAVNMSFGGMDPAAMMMNPMQMIFGSPSGPSGYIVEANGGVYQSYSRNSTMLTPAVEGRSSLGDDQAIGRVTENLPDGRYAEFYFGVRPILDQVVPFLGMMGMPLPDLPDQIPPIGFGIASRNEGAVAGVFIPAQTIKSALQIAHSFEGMQGAAGGDDDEGPGF